MHTSHPEPRRLGYALAVGILVGMSAALTFSAGFFFRDFVDLTLPTAFASAAAIDEDDNYSLLAEVQGLLNQHYLRDQPEIAQREYAAIRGVLSTLEDRYTFFIDPPVAQSESDALAGTYGGVGVQINRNENGEFVIFPFNDSPAKIAGLEDGDILNAVNGNLLDNDTRPDSVDQMLRGEVKPGNGVDITVVKPTGEKFTVFIEFAVIDVPSVIWRVTTENNQIGYIQIIRFTGRTPEEVSEAIDELNDEKISALILDLRNNSGGLLQESVEVAGQFLESGEVVLFEKLRSTERALNADGEMQIADMPIVVLVNQGTASASELLAGAIQDHGRGILIGQQTFGKGTVQQIFRLSDQSSIHITSAEWLTPNRRQIENEGLEPDIIMIPDINGRDVELGEAIRHLQDIELG
jgi:carboxyl-terminal processing protease